MSTSTQQVSRCAASASPYSDLGQSQLHAQAENALSVALWHLRQPSVNLHGATRKAVQALKAMHELRGLVLEPCPALVERVGLGGKT